MWEGRKEERRKERASVYSLNREGRKEERRKERASVYSLNTTEYVMYLL